MKTKYLRTVNFATLRRDFELSSQLPVARLLKGSPDEAPYGIDQLPSYCHSEVFVVHTSEGKADLHAWLGEDTIDELLGSSHDILKSWMLSIDPSCCRRDPLL